MMFNSINFIIFFVATFCLFYATPIKYRWLVLLLASSIFYASLVPYYLLLVYGVILTSYLVGLVMDRQAGVKRKIMLWLGITGAAAPLLFYKYLNFFQDNINTLANALHWNYSGAMLHFILPIGLSFYTFQAISYLVEIYWGKQKPERHLGIYSLFILFFPQILAGPIARPQSLLPQLNSGHAFNGDEISNGLKLMLWGFFKKLVIADRLSIAVNHVYGATADASGVTLLISTVLFAFQIYCDFSGYSDIAIGAAQVFGFKLMHNFNRPYFSKSIAEFWNRWHISLSSWMRDYIYIPLGGSRVSKWKWARNILITFLVSGFWHGANWTFIFWGLLNGSYIVISRYTEKPRKFIVNLIHLDKHSQIHKLLRISFTFSLITITWIFFRAASLHEALYILQKIAIDVPLHLLNIHLPHLDDYRLLASQLGMGIYNLTIAIGSIAVMEFVHLLERNRPMSDTLRNKPLWIRWSFYYAIILAIALFGAYHGQAEFIYFKF
ncbi:MAG: MBOAT family protein [Patescibacteria group bacterium]|nr:MBOAT family protein [Patescibacteria group bacterium]